MKRIAIAGLLGTITVAILLIGLLAFALYSPRQWFIDYVLDQSTLGKDQRVLDFLISDLRDLLIQVVVIASVVVLITSWIWFVRSAFARIDVPGKASEYRTSWAALAITSGIITSAWVGYFTFSNDYLDVLRPEVRWAVVAFSLVACWILYWVVTAMWTPSLQSPAVLFSGGLFRWLRRRVSL